MNFEALHNIGVSSNPIDNLVESYVASADGNLNAGDLCEFINGQVRKTSYSTGTSVLTQISAGTNYYNSPTILDSTHVLVTYVYNNGANSYVYAAVLTISGSAINIGTLTQITGVISNNNLSSTLLDSTHVLITYESVGGSYYLYAVVLTISGSTISIGTLTQINSVTTTFESLITLDSTHVLVNYAGTTNYFLYGVVLTISGSAISIGSITQITSLGTIYATSSVMLNSTQVVVTYTGANMYMWSVILTISEAVITVGVLTQINSIAANYISSTLLDSTHVLLGYNGTNGYLYTIILNISGSTITFGVATLIYSTTTYYINSVRLDSNHVVLIFQNADNYYLYGVVLTTSGSTINIGAVTLLNNANAVYISAIAINYTNILITWTNTYLYSMLIGVNGTTISNTVVTHVLQPNVLCLTPATVGNTSKFGIKGIFGGLTGLIPSVTYYSDNNGNLTTTITTKNVGVALSATELLIQNGFWER